MKKFLKVFLIFTLIVGVLVPNFTYAQEYESNTLILGERYDIEDQEWKFEDGNGNLFTESGVSKQYMNEVEDDNIVFCLHMWRSNSTYGSEGEGYKKFEGEEIDSEELMESNLEGEDILGVVPPVAKEEHKMPYSDELKEKLSDITYVGWNNSEKTNKDYFYTQVMIWENLGMQATGDTKETESYKNYSKWKNDRISEIENINKKPEFTHENLTYDDSSNSYKFTDIAGDSVIELDDKNDVLKNYYVESEYINTSVVDNKLVLDVDNKEVDSKIKLVSKKRDFYGVNTVYWKNNAYQAFGLFKYSNYNTLDLILNLATTNIKVNKEDIDSSELLENAEIGLFDENDNLISKTFTDSNGEAKFENIKKARYKVKEISPPEGYIKSDEEVGLDIRGLDDANKEVVIKNKKKPKLLVNKVDSNGISLKGAHLGIYDDSGKMIYDWISDGSTMEFSELDPDKTYTIRELESPDGYLKNNDIKFKTDRDRVEVEVVNNPTIVTVKKLDQSGKLLPGAKLAVLDKNGNTLESFISDGTPKVISGLKYGSYILREIEAPEGFEKSRDIEFIVDKDTSDLEISLTNNKLTIIPSLPSTGINYMGSSLAVLMLLLSTFIFKFKKVNKNIFSTLYSYIVGTLNFILILIETNSRDIDKTATIGRYD